MNDRDKYLKKEKKKKKLFDPCRRALSYPYEYVRICYIQRGSAV